MTAEEYRRAVDAVSFRPDFVQDTLSLLEARRKESSAVKKISVKTVLIAAALVAALTITASAAIYLLTPGQVAQEVGADALARAFESADAVSVNDTRTMGDYQVTLMGLVSGAGLQDMGQDLDESETYAVLAYTCADGALLEDDGPILTATPLVEGYAPWQVNAWTLGGGMSGFAQDGVYYYLAECGPLEPFADHTVYLAVYPGQHAVPSAERFSFGDDGAIAYQSGQEGLLFPLPLDPAKADPAAVEALLGGGDEEPEGEAEPEAPVDQGEAQVISITPDLLPGN